MNNGIIHPSQDEIQGQQSLRLRSFWDTVNIGASVAANTEVEVYTDVAGKNVVASNLSENSRLPAGWDATILAVRAEYTNTDLSTASAFYLNTQVVFNLYTDQDDNRLEIPLGNLPSGTVVGGVNQFDSVANTGTSVIYLSAPSNGDGSARPPMSPQFQIGINDGKSFRATLRAPNSTTLAEQADIRIYLDCAVWRSVR